MQSSFDVVIVGAGAAGLSAALRLASSPLKIAVLEARTRVGGRAHTIAPAPGLVMDEGCGWLHSADVNPLVPRIEGAGFTIHRKAASWSRQAFDIGFSRAEQQAFDAAFAAFDTRLETAAQQEDPEDTAAAFFEPGNRWNPLIDAVSTYYNGTTYDRVSVRDYGAYRDTGTNWRVREGYGAAIAALGAGIQPVLDCAVTHIDHGQSPIRLATTRGTITARAVIVCVPTPHLAEERIRFSPTLPDKVEAAGHLPLGFADKAFLHLADPDAVPEEDHLFGRTDTADTGSYHLRPFGRPYIEAYVGGDNAARLEGEGEGGIAAFAMEELKNLMGADFVRGLTPITETAWRRDPWARGAYSHALPGHSEARAALAAPTNGRLFWAGEATHRTAFSTARGAWESGERAADEVLSALRGMDD